MKIGAGQSRVQFIKWRDPFAGKAAAITSLEEWRPGLELNQDPEHARRSASPFRHLALVTNVTCP